MYVLSEHRFWGFVVVVVVFVVVVVGLPLFQFQLLFMNDFVSNPYFVSCFRHMLLQFYLHVYGLPNR